MSFARTFAAARVGDRVLLVYVENDGFRGALRSALFSRSVVDGVTTLTRVRDDLLLAPNVRSVSLVWDGHRGAVAFVVPRMGALPPPSERPRPRGPTLRREGEGALASLDDPLGPVVGSGGEVAFLPLDADGAPQGAPRVVFSENNRLWRVALASEGLGWALAWTGGVVTDGEVRGTVRAMRLTAEGRPLRPMASAMGWSGDVGDQVAVTRLGDATLVLFSGAQCLAREGEAPPPLSLNDDPSRDIDPPGRNPQPQAPVLRAPGPPVQCDATRFHIARLHDDHRLDLVASGPWITADTGAVASGALLVPLGVAGGHAVARLTFDERGFGEAWDVLSRAAIAPVPRPAVPPQATDNLRRPPPEFEYPLAEHPVPPPELPTTATLRQFLSPPRVLRGVPTSEEAPVVAVTHDRRGVALLRPNHGMTLLATTASFFYDVAVLPGEGDTHLIFTREGTWSGPLRFFAPGAEGPSEPVHLPVAYAVPPPSAARPSRYPLRAPYVYDAEFARLFVRTRTLRAQFMRHENIAGLLASRPTAPSDPRMPGLLAVRRNLQNRWEVSCAALRRRAIALARNGAGDEPLRGVDPLCEIHGPLQLGVPIDPSL